jgi:flavin reductase (DIM6/NTAB) family NADH-FMN oxidoreductase RutF
MKIIPANLNKREPYELLMSALLPRPIALVSTIGEDGVYNVAPFSCLTPVGLKPALLCLAIGWKRDGQKKDTLRNIESSKDFVVNVVEETFAEAMNQASAEYPSDVDEFKEVGLTSVKSDLIKAPRVAESPINMECKLVQILEFGQVPTGGHMIIGEVVLIHLRDELWAADQINISKWKPLGRLGGQFYCKIRDIFEMKRPDIP